MKRAGVVVANRGMVAGRSSDAGPHRLSGKASSPARNQESGMLWAAQLFLISLLVPFPVQIGTLVLMPHRVLLVVLFIPFIVRLFIQRKSGAVVAIDWLFLGSSLWVGPSLLWNHPIEFLAEPFGIHLLEFFGAYLVARVSIRSAVEFEKMIKLFFYIVLFLLPFAAIESITRRPVILDLIPGSGIAAVDAGIRMGMRRAQTVFSHPILYGVFVSTGLGLFWYSIRPRWLRFPSVPIVLAATIFSLSTGALLSIFVQGALIGWEYIAKKLVSRWRLFAMLCVIGYVTIDILSNRSPFHVLVTYASFSTSSAYNRILIWQYGMENVIANPIFGLGLRDWVRPSWMSSSADNFWLLLTMRYGLPTIAMIAAAVILIFRRIGMAQLSQEIDSRSRAAYLVTIGGIMLAGGTVHYWHAMMAFVTFIFGSGIWLMSGGAADRGNDLKSEAEVKYDSPTYSRRPTRTSSTTFEDYARKESRRRGQ
jgi:hypothetical protein